MEIKKIGIIMNGVTGRMGTNQHLERSIIAIIKEGGIKINDKLTVVPDPILTGRNFDKLKKLAKKYNIEKVSIDLPSALNDSYYRIFFDSSGTLYRTKFVEMAAAAKKAIYCEKPTAVTTEEALKLVRICQEAEVKNGVVQDKLWLPGLRKFQMLKEQGFFGDIFSVKGDFGYWVYEGFNSEQPAQRPSWNYKKEDGGGLVIDMHCHWRYVIDNLFGEIKSVMTRTVTHIPKRIDEEGKEYKCTADDTAYAIFELKNGVICQFVSSWATRVRRDDLLTIQVDGTKGSALIGLRDAWVQHVSGTPKPIWNPDIPQPINFYDNWQKVPEFGPYDNAFKIQWELFIKHVVTDTPFPWTLIEGAKGVQLAEKSLESNEKRAFINLEELK